MLQDKSFQLVSDSDRSEIDDDPPTFIESLHTEETVLMSTYKSEETLKADFDEAPLERTIPKSASISTINDSHHFISELPEEDSASKVQRWCRDTHNDFVQKPNSSIWKNFKRRPQNLPFTSSPLLQRLKSPQNLSLLSPRPYQVRPSSVPSLSPGAVFIPPLDLSGLKSDSEQTAEQEASGRQPVINTKQVCAGT